MMRNSASQVRIVPTPADLFVVLAIILLAATSAPAERLPLKTYTSADGLAHNEINKIVRDSRGFLWFCTADGLSRFDGYVFTNYGTAQGLPHPYVNDLLETRAGEVWLATNGGLVRFNPRGIPSKDIVYANDAPTDAQPMFSVVMPDDSDRRARAVNVLFEDHNGAIWCGTRKGLYRLEGADKRFTLRPIDIGMPNQFSEQSIVLDILEDKRGPLWVASPSGLYRRWPDGSFARYAMRDGLPGDYLHDLLMDHAGRLWVATRSPGFFSVTADETHKPPIVTSAFSLKDGLPADWVFQLFESSDRKFWIATAAGLAEFFPDGDEHGQHFHSFNERNGLIYHDITALNEDSGGNLWLGSYAGAMRLARNGFTTYDQQDGLDQVFSIFGNRQGGVCFRGQVLGDGARSVFEGAKLDLLHPYMGKHVTRYGCFDGQSFTWFLPDALQQINLGWVGEGLTLQSRNGEWWFGTGAGLYRFAAADNLREIKSARPLAIYDLRNGLASPQVFRLFEDSRGDMWVSSIGAVNGLAHWDRASGTMRDVSNASGLPASNEDVAHAFAEDRAGNIWIGFASGLARYHQGSFAFFTTNEGLPSGGIAQIYLDRAGELWLASAHSGLIRVDEPQAERPAFVSYTTAQGLSSDLTSAITEDLNGHIYVATGRGLDELDPVNGRVKHYTSAEGLASGSLVAAFCDHFGTLWFGTTKGLSRFVPLSEDLKAAPAILITKLSVAGSAQRVSAFGETEMSLPRFAPNQNQVQIDFVGLSFAPGEVVRYQYKLEGADADWSAPTEQRTVNFANLAPRNYKFLVRALNSEGVTSTTPAAVSFTILPPVWRRWWFVSLVVLAVALTVYALFRYRVARILELANIRTHIAADLHDDIGSNLTRIAILSEVAHSQLGNKSPNVESPLLSIANISRESVASMSDIVWAINPKRDTLLDLIQRMRRFATEILTPRAIEFQFRAPDADHDLKLGANFRRDMFLLYKEALNNAVRHSGCTSASIDFQVERSWLVLTVRDDGRGFDLEKASEGQGLLSMTRRAGRLSGELRIDSKPGKGTEICLRVPRRGH
jgi:ligand-binding sensor domain-containing protein/signal transduction histidine kinase